MVMSKKTRAPPAPRGPTAVERARAAAMARAREAVAEPRAPAASCELPSMMPDVHGTPAAAQRVSMRVSSACVPMRSSAETACAAAARAPGCAPLPLRTTASGSSCVCFIQHSPRVQPPISPPHHTHAVHSASSLAKPLAACA
jgi:hypothetical protein